MCRLTGADGLAGIVAPALAGVCEAEPEFGAEQPVAIVKATTATADAMYVLLRTRIERSFL
jgi:hypothetical protein